MCEELGTVECNPATNERFAKATLHLPSHQNRPLAILNAVKLLMLEMRHSKSAILRG